MQQIVLRPGLFGMQQVFIKRQLYLYLEIIPFDYRLHQASLFSHGNFGVFSWFLAHSIKFVRRKVFLSCSKLILFQLR